LNTNLQKSEDIKNIMIAAQDIYLALNNGKCLMAVLNDIWRYIRRSGSEFWASQFIFGM